MKIFADLAEFEDSPFNDKDEIALFEEKICEIEKRCEAVGLSFERGFSEDELSYISIRFQSGRDFRLVYIGSVSAADALLSIEFEKVRFISGFEALYITGSNYVEAGIRATRLSPMTMLKRINRINGLERDSWDNNIIFDPPKESRHPSIEVGYCSETFSKAIGWRSPRFSIVLKNIATDRHDEVLNKLIVYSNSLFFEIDNIYSGTFILERDRRLSRQSIMKKLPGANLVYPRSEYNEEAMSLYMYAQSARQMPLLQFLAFYQSIEFYFVRYSQVEARRRVGNMLKNPSFKIHSDDDIDRLISLLRERHGGATASERDQLKAVIKECLSAEDNRAFIESDPARFEFFSKKSSGYHKIPISSKTVDIRDDVARRIYDIRCKIVHTKNEHENDDGIRMILPFSDDADRLFYDVELAQFIARNVIIAGGRELIG